MAAAGTDRQRDFITTFFRSPFGKSIIGRLPGGVRRSLFAGRRRQRQLVAQLRSRWHRSLQLRVVSTTLVLSALVIALLGFFLVQSIAAGLTTNAENSARSQVKTGAEAAIGQSSLQVLEPPASQFTAVSTAEATAQRLQQASGSTGSYVVFIQVKARHCLVGRARQRRIIGLDDHRTQPIGQVGWCSDTTPALCVGRYAATGDRFNISTTARSHLYVGECVEVTFAPHDDDAIRQNLRSIGQVAATADPRDCQLRALSVRIRPQPDRLGMGTNPAGQRR